MFLALIRPNKTATGERSVPTHGSWHTRDILQPYTDSVADRGTDADRSIDKQTETHGQRTNMQSEGQDGDLKDGEETEKTRAGLRNRTRQKYIK